MIFSSCHSRLGQKHLGGGSGGNQVPNVIVLDDYGKLCQTVAQQILTLSNQKIFSQGFFSLVLSGGSTPQGLYACMASPEFGRKFQWKKIHIFFSDERFVAPDDPRSNFRMVSEALLSKVPIPREHIHAVATENVTVQESARLYGKDIRAFVPFDLILLGVGEDGHTASLFPGNRALSVRDRLAVEVSQKGIPEKRISLTFPVINRAKAIFFFVSGPQKADIIQKVLINSASLRGPAKPAHNLLPASTINPVQGRLSWYMDKAAAQGLSKAPQRLGVAADHGGWELKKYLVRKLRRAKYQVIDFGNRKFDPQDDYPDFIVPLARAVAAGKVDRGIALCGSGVGACIAANKIPGVRACMIHEKFSARQGVEDDDMNVICLGKRVLDQATAWELVTIFLASRFSFAERHRRRLAKVFILETK